MFLLFSLFLSLWWGLKKLPCGEASVCLCASYLYGRKPYFVLPKLGIVRCGVSEIIRSRTQTVLLCSSL